MRNVALLAIKFGWSRAEIMALPAAEFEYYVKLLIQLSKPEP